MLLLVLFILIQLADVYTTAKGLKTGDTEASPLPGKLFAKLGFWKTTALIKGLGLLLAVGATAFVKGGWLFTGGLDILGLGVLYHNYRVLKSK